MIKNIESSDLGKLRKFLRLRIYHLEEENKELRNLLINLNKGFYQDELNEQLSKNRSELKAIGNKLLEVRLKIKDSDINYDI